MTNYKIKIIPGDPPTVEKDGQKVIKKDDDRVKWESKSKDWAVVFEGDTPFELHCFSPSASDSGKIMPNAQLKQYKYTIFVDGRKSDPILIVS